MDFQMRIYGRNELRWKENKLYLEGTGGYVAKISLDLTYPNMYRYRTKAFWDAGESDMFNISRAKDNAKTEVIYALNTTKKPLL